MAPTPPLPVTEDTPPDMLAGSMDLHVVLPTGRSVKMSVERGTPMMDLLVQVATANKIPPGGHVIQAVGERGLLPYKPSTPIGALDTWTIQIVPKSRPSSTAGSKTASSKASNQQPFEQTFRLQVHLPRNQLFVARVSPKTVLSDVLNLACTEKNLDPSKYELRHPANLEERLRPDWTLADYKLQEVTMVAKRGRPLGAGLSSSDIMALQKEEEKRRQQTRAGGSTGSAVLGLMFNKRSQSSVCDGSVSSDSLGGRSISPINSDDTPSPPGSSLPPPRPARKRRPAPKPPGPPAAVISHSRNSSDSSGYHEASVLSESPESNGLSSSPSGTLPRRSKLTSATPAPPQNTSLSRSLSNLTTVSNGGNKPAPRPEGMKSCTHSVSTSSLASSGHGKKKKAAPPPPPVAANSSKMTPREPVQPQRTLSLSTLSSQSSIDNCDSAADGMLERNRLSSSVSVSRQEIQPVPEEVSKIPPIEDKRSSEMSRESSIEMYSETSSILSSPERQTNPLDIKTKSTAVQEKNAKNQAKQQSPELESITLKKTEVSNAANIESFPVSPIVEIKNKNNKLKCEERPLEPQSKLLVEKPPASSKVEPLPDVVSGLQLDSEEIDRAFQSVTDELEAAILADELKQASPLPDLPSPVTGSRSPSLSDWEYQLPAPPTAFQDRQSPTPTLGETIELGETGVFQENLPSEPFPPRFSNPKSQASEQISRESVPQSTPSSAQCLPSQDIDERLHKSKTTINPLYNAELFEREAIQNEELNERLSGNTAGHKTSLHNGVGKNDEEEDDWKPQQLRAVSEVDIELKNSSNNVIRRSSFNDVGQSNQLKNFTITTYQRPRDTDNIFSEDNGSRRIILSEFKKPLEATLSKQQNGSAHPLASSTSLPRTNSFNTSNMETVEHSVVRRSTSHVSLVNSARNLRAKSIGNISAVTSREGRKNSESEATVDSGHERLRKTSSEMAINRGSDDINKVEQSAGHPASPDEPLQSLQVMRNILNPNDQEPRKDTNSNEQVARRVSSEMHSAQKQEDTQVSQPVVKPAVTIESQSESTTNGDVTKRYRYTPPSVNFSTWSERPKSQVSIKLDSDYRIGTGQGGSQESQSVTEVKTEQRERLSDTTSGGEPKNTSGVKLLQGEVSNPAINQTTKVEPVPLSMRIVSHTTSSSYSKRTPSFSNQRIDFVSKTNDQNSKETHQVVVRTSSYNTAQIADPSRIPIVRAVELKKSFLQGQQQQQQPQQQQNKSTSVQLSWNGTDDLAKRNGTTDVKRNSENEEPEIFQGVNNLAKMFSAAAPNSECVRVGFRGNSTRPVSAYLYNGSNDATESSDMKRNSTSTSALNTVGIGDLYVGNTSSQLNTNGPKKYTSVVGINGAAISTSSFREPDVNRNHPKVTNSASIKVNGFAVPKQPMPVVKGFRYPSNGTNHSDSSLLAANSHKSSTVSEPLTVKVQRSDSYTNQNQRNSSSEPAPTFNVRIQHTPTVKIDSLQAKTRQTTIPVPPPAPAPLKKTVSVRPKSFAASEPSPRDQLMDAIRNFGGRNNLKQTGGS
ncbi:protein cordon-bleu isoform X3 [Anabrus simplex]|uniref:protein cordon-bleu isoform X3 n=1 Tax=Anabrus simplex TaxID=316456 RepID=UPI0035A2CC40